MQYKKNIEEYFIKDAPRSAEMNALRAILKSFPFQETVKWAFPVYTIDNKNIVGLGAFKAYAGVWFFQGVFLKDQASKLVNAQEGKTQGMRQWRLDSLEEIQKNEGLIREYIQEAIDNHHAGLKVSPKPKSAAKPVVIPPELEAALNENPQLKESFESYAPSHRREYAEYIAEAKREATKLARLEKIIPMILDGAGLWDKYKK